MEYSCSSHDGWISGFNHYINGTGFSDGETKTGDGSTYGVAQQQ
jgi:hypothetical protein